MAKFQFRLATLLKLREGVRNERRAQLAEAYQAQATLDLRNLELQQQVLGLQEMTRQTARPGSVELDRMIQAQRFQAILKSQQKVIENQEKLLTDEIEKRRLALVAADRDVRVLTKLGERCSEKHDLRQRKLEIKEMDEVAERRRGPTFVTDRIDPREV